MNKSYCIALDSDGHFQLSDITNRKETINLLKSIHDGDYWADIIDDTLEAVGLNVEQDLDTVDDKTWVEFVKYFEQRATMEIKILEYEMG